MAARWCQLRRNNFLSQSRRSAGRIQWWRTIDLRDKGLAVSKTSSYFCPVLLVVREGRDWRLGRQIEVYTHKRRRRCSVPGKTSAGDLKSSSSVISFNIVCYVSSWREIEKFPHFIESIPICYVYFPSGGEQRGEPGIYLSKEAKQMLSAANFAIGLYSR